MAVINRETGDDRSLMVRFGCESACEASARPRLGPATFAAALRRGAALTWHALARCYRSTSGGAMLAGGVITLATMTSVGGLMTNYAWREAQWEELRAAVRAAISSVGPGLGVVGGGSDAEARAAIAEFAAALAGLSVGADDVTISYDAATDTTTVVVGGGYEFDSLWGGGGDEETVEVEVKVRLEFDRYEVALALDVSDSMRGGITGSSDSRIDVLKSAISGTIDALAATNAAQPGSVMVSLVPYSSAVNVADTCNADANGACQAARSPGKERYLRMLAGAGGTMARTLSAAKAVRTAGTGGHWVDTFHHYGPARTHGTLQRRYLPADLLDNQDWNLRRTGVDIDVSAEVPGLGTWRVDDEDFWNGCVMARWGAYWDARARGPGWTADNADNWPAKKAVAAWSPGGAALAASTPLHLSDAPPDAAAPSTLFTAFSWPDSRIAGRADSWLSGAMAEMLVPGEISTGPAVRDNDWSLAGNGGARFCPSVAIAPLTDDMTELRHAVNALETSATYRHGWFPAGVGATYVGLGVVWALRTLSPLWQGVWDVKDARSATRPAAPCASDTDTACDPLLSKAIILVSDGANYPGRLGTQLRNSYGVRNNPLARTESICLRTDIADYRAAGAATDASGFNGHFAAFTDAAGTLTPAGLAVAVDGFLTHASAQLHPAYGYPAPAPVTAARRAAMYRALSVAADGGAPTPWQLFRGQDAGVVDAMVAEPAFGFDGRPTLIDERCRPSSSFGPYGRVDDLVYTGQRGISPNAVPIAPVADRAPFEVASLPVSAVGDGTGGSYSWTATTYEMEERMDGWLVDGCEIAGERGVRIHGVFIGPHSFERGIAALENCVDKAGGDANSADVYVTPTADDLADAFRELLTVRRNLRFL